MPCAACCRPLSIDFADMSIEQAELVTVPILDARLAGVNARTDRLEAIMSARFETIEARLAAMDAKMERWAIRLVLVMVVTQTALGPIGAGALDAVRRVLSALIR